MIKQSKLVIIITAIICSPLLSCDDDSNAKKINTQESTSWNTIDGKSFGIPTYVVVPEGQGPHPAIVVLHGCGGLLSDSNNGAMASHFNFWAEFGKSNKVVMIFPDSFTPRGLDEFCGVAPPEDAICSPAYERTNDVADILQWISKQDYIDKNRIGLLGFSHGGSTTISSIVDTDFLTFSSRTVTINGISFSVPGPVQMPETPTFKAAVAYYPGAGFYGYFGNDYLPYAPLMINAASLDPLYTSGATEKLVANAISNGASETNGNVVTLNVYPDAAHSFDGEINGADGEASDLARTNTIVWFKRYLSF